VNAGVSNSDRPAEERGAKRKYGKRRLPLFEKEYASAHFFIYTFY